VSDLNLPHGGALTERLVAPNQAIAWRKPKKLKDLWPLTLRQLCDLEMIMSGAFSPLTGFLKRSDYDTVVTRMRLQDGTFWPVPITLDVTDNFAEKLTVGDAIGLMDADGALLAALEVEDIWRPDLQQEAIQVYQTQDVGHSGVARLLSRSHKTYLGGTIHGLEMPQHFDFPHLRHTPRQLRDLLASRGWSRVVAFQTRNPMHRGHVELIHRAARAVDGNILLHPVAGETQADDFDHYTRMRCYEHVQRRNADTDMLLSMLPLAMRMAGPREALLHAIIRKNYGCTHLIVGRDHAGPTGQFYPPYAAQESIAQHEDELGIKMVPFQELSYVKELDTFLPQDELEPGQTILSVSGSELRRCVKDQLPIPSWLTYPEVVEELRRANPANENQGVTIFFTGLSGAGKSTIAKALLARLMAAGSRSVTLLDGDIVRQNLSSELGFSRAHRDLNILRIGFVASEITKHGGVAICAPIAPYTTSRRKVREMIEAHGWFIEVYVSTPLGLCEARDRKGLYAKARARVIKEFTGIDDPYEVPEHPELTIDTGTCTPLEAADSILRVLEQKRCLVGNRWDWRTTDAVSDTAALVFT
jgi:sulfate adenylyltransferase